MQSGIVKTIFQIGIFLICAQAIVHFRPKAYYEKYLKMLVSIMILMQLFLAVGGIFSEAGKAKLQESMQRFTENLNEGMRQASENAFLTEQDMTFQITVENPETVNEGSEQVEDIAEISVQIEPISPIAVE